MVVSLATTKFELIKWERKDIDMIFKYFELIASLPKSIWYNIKIFGL